jgi:hypothetical protein
VSKEEDLPEDKDKEWDKILDEINLAYLPIEYLKNIIITFEDGNVWDINISDSRKNQSIDDIEIALEELFEEYDETIESIDFRLDVDRVKKDLSKKVNRLLKNK